MSPTAAVMESGLNASSPPLPTVTWWTVAPLAVVVLLGTGATDTVGELPLLPEPYPPPY